MGVSNEWLRTDNKAGSVDLSSLALPAGHKDRIEVAEFRVARGLWYVLCSLDETELCEDAIGPVKLDIRGPNRIGFKGEEIHMAALAIKNWLAESRHYPSHGNVDLENAIIHEGDRLTINGHATSPVEVAWVRESVVPPSKPDYTNESRFYANI